MGRHTYPTYHEQKILQEILDKDLIKEDLNKDYYLQEIGYIIKKLEDYNHLIITLRKRNAMIRDLKPYKSLAQQILTMTNIHGVYKDDTDCVNAIREAIYRELNRHINP